MDKLDREIILQTMRGYEEANRISKADRFFRLKERKIEESILIFRSLYRAWEKTGKTMGGDKDTLSRLRIEESVRIREIMNQASVRMTSG
ncbi:MAG TPA: hypothetical protein VMN57_12345 [Anaerolineales bacterium]|nr:hypothetical protein [Anaerolineales bacterium]